MNLEFYTKIKIIFFNFGYLFSDKNNFYSFLLKNIKKSNAQVFQDLFVLYHLKNKKFGKFIEIGGGNGETISNTYLLEKKFKWKGLICEPNTLMQKKIVVSRKAKLIKAAITNRCKKSGVFYENIDPYQSSTMNKKNNSFKKIKVNFMCLNHLLKKYKMKFIDYISIDTEGNEFQILKNFNFKKYKVYIFTIEHNFDKDKREEIYNLLTKNKYKRIFTNISYMDDWYILNENN